MSRLLAPLLSLFLLCGPGSSWGAEPNTRLPEGTSGNGRLTYVQDLPVIFLSGTPEELGRQQGELFGPTVGPLLGITRRVIAMHGYDRAWPFIAATSRVLLHNAPEGYQQELDALIEAGHLDRDAVLVGNSLVEIRRMGGCSTFVVLPERSRIGGLIFGRNFDFPAFNVLDRMSCLFIVRPAGKHAYASVGYPGMIGVLSGMNDAGLTLATMDVYESADGSPIFDPTGVPLALTYRRILEECTTVAEAEQLLKATHITTYMNLAVADQERAVVFELTPQTVGVRAPQNHLLACTNHFQLDGLCTHPSCRRIQVLNHLNQTQPQFDVPDVKQALHRVNQGDLTLQTMVFEPAALRVHLAMNGPPPVSAAPLKTFELREWLQPAEAKVEAGAASR